jgi:release factor glutamine methyltransferase
MSLPEQYMTGKAYFMDLELKVTRDTLIPRPETEILVEKALEYIKDRYDKRPVRICDIGTGSGNIAISLAYYLKNVQILAVDISEEALLIATENAKNISVQDNVSFLKSDVLDAVNKNERFDMVISNPPYICKKHKHLLPPEVLAEPELALLAGEEGMDVYKKIADSVKGFLTDKGMLLMEIGFDQKEKIQILLENKGFKNIEFFKDYSSIDRIVKAENG